MADDDLSALRDSIENIGVRNPITVHDGMVLDGWHRYTIAQQLGMECPEVELPSDVDPRDFVKAQNRARRHLGAGQWALIEVQLWDLRPVGRPAKETPQSLRNFDEAAPPSAPEGNSAIIAEIQPPPKPKLSAAKIAEQLNISERTVQLGVQVKNNCEPQVIEAVKVGSLPLMRAVEISRLPRDQQVQAMQEPRTKKAAKPPKAGTTRAATLKALQALQKAQAQLAEQDESIKALLERNAELEAQVAIGFMDGSDADKEAAAKLIADLRRQIMVLEYELAAVRVTRDAALKDAQDSKLKAKRLRLRLDRAQERVAA
jgi:hypothetical protein